MTEDLKFEPALSKADLLSPTVSVALAQWQAFTPVDQIFVSEIDPSFTHSAQFCEHYGVLPAEGANCVIVEAVRGEKRTLAACLAPINCRMDINKVARKTLDARRVSFAPLEEVIKQTEMEYGAVTPIGLPGGWPVLIDSRLVALPRVIIGAGLVKAKLSVPGKLLAELPGAIVVEGLGILTSP